VKNALPNSPVDPANETIVEGLVRPIGVRCVHPTTAGLQDMYDATYDTPIIDPWLASRISGEMRLKPCELLLGQPKKVIVHSRAPSGILESKTASRSKFFEIVSELFSEI
jgi:hypothetical protein